jgi:hypothetical protein
MRRRKFAGRKRKSHQTGTRWLFAGVLLLLVVLGIWGVRSSLVHRERASLEHAGRTVAAPPATAENISELHGEQTFRTVYPYSVISGGVENVQELRKDIAEDPVVRAHYAGFDLMKAHVIRLPQGRLAYVSYRIGDQVYWTTHKLRLAKDEAVITDGAHTARTRCGNLVSDTAVHPNSAKEPAIDTLDAPTVPGILFPGAWTPPVRGTTPPLVALDPAPPGHPFNPPSFFLPPGGPGGPGDPPGGGDPPGDPPTSVPEPAALLLLLISLPSLWMLSKQSKRSRR